LSAQLYHTLPNFPLLDPPPQQQGNSDYDDDNNNDSNRRRRRGRTLAAIRREAHANTERNRRERERAAFAALRGVLVGAAQDRVSVLERATCTIEELRYENQQQQQQLQQQQQQIERLTRQLQE
jgi:hypothetical protein